MSIRIDSSPPPEPWRLVRGRSREWARLLRALLEHRSQLLKWYPFVPVPTLGTAGTTPLAPVLMVWSRWGYAHGACPRCGAPALATFFGGALARGSVTGYCTGCARMVTRFVGGLGRVVSGCNRATARTPYHIPFGSFPGGWQMGGEPIALVAVLQELGAQELPDPRSRAFRR